ncbi:MAG: NUDIX domain-containing protein [Candidatus Aenigmatarchaeota archaeon]|nr:NUDIX domain-containing protein [Candidatus Aenigmarchaeota archaeon]
MKNSFAVVFDFDGVIVDSLDECFLVSVRAYNELGGNIKLSNKAKLLYKKYRPYLRITEDHLPALKMIENGIFDKDYIKNSRKKFEKKKKEFVKRFYEIRKEIRKEDIKKWISLHKPFENVVKLIKRNYKRWNIFISSTKDKNSIVKILRSLGIKIPENKIFSREFSNDKSKHVKMISRISKIPEEKIIFIDDVLENLKMIKRKSNARLALASWGYTTKEHEKIAKEMKIKVLQLEKLENEINDMISIISPTIHKTIAIIIKNNGKFLLTKRAGSPERNYWGFPGGHVESNENIFEAAVREAKEEVGEVKINKRYLFSFVHDVGINHKHECYVFSGKLVGKLKKNREVKKFGFFSIKEMKRMNLTNYTLQIINKILNDENFAKYI